MISIGEIAPDFTLPRTDNGSAQPLLTLSALRPQKVVLYFYPKDNTPGCTTEALDFTRLADEFAACDTVVIGVSKDSLKKHENFCAKHGLGVTLVSDENGTVCEDFGAWGEKQMYGKTYEGIIRSTVLIGADGAIAQHWPKVKVKGHAQEVLAAARALT
ncbi:alkyl hydroperoxide reductase [Thioclava sp. SK-1]|uniref:peroxiredoxin n=1 Tax=Thioclava sp. SK-1 TaxID=1889770 RepID=UPI00082509C2|nr:peroxiredoxin [Thioclava sp. SK-1]OCX66087.1 alkyl hydroperoxide reductase [Thioclava sp. SK-1]